MNSMNNLHAEYQQQPYNVYNNTTSSQNSQQVNSVTEVEQRKKTVNDLYLKIFQSRKLKLSTMLVEGSHEIPN